MKKNPKIYKYFIQENKRIKELYKKFDKKKKNICLVVDKNKKFIGIVTPTDIQKGLINGLSLNSKIKEVTNYKPLKIVGKINDNKISDLVSKKNFNYIN